MNGLAWTNAGQFLSVHYAALSAVFLCEVIQNHVSWGTAAEHSFSNSGL